jgi:hypothetical protein
MKNKFKIDCSKDMALIVYPMDPSISTILTPITEKRLPFYDSQEMALL